ncbi:MAG: transposase [Chloroflexi bacterium]|nr:transposase [Chloroflexota bacterium]
MIFATSLPDAKTFFAAAKLPASTVALLTRLVVASLSTLRSASQAACAIRTDPRHRAQLVRFLARQGWSKDWLILERLADVLLEACRHEQGDWLFVLDQTTHTTLGRHAQNTYSCRNTSKRQKNSSRKQKKTPPRLNHVFVCGLLIAPRTGTRLPCVRPYYTKDYCQQQAAKARPGRTAPAFATQADIAAQMIRAVRVPKGSRVLVLGDTAFEAKQIRAACRERGFDWITPANPERVLAGQKGRRRRLDEVSTDFTAETLTRIELCPGLTDWWRHQRGSQAKAWRGRYGRLYWARAETLEVHNVGGVRVVFSTNEQPKAGQKVVVKKILLSNLSDWDAQRLVSAYAARWQIEVFFREMKSDLGLSNYRVREFQEVEGWVQACGVAFCYLEWYRLRRQATAQKKEWWFRQRTRGLAVQVRQEIEWSDLLQVATEMETEEGRARLRACLLRAVPLEQRRSA